MPRSKSIVFTLLVLSLLGSTACGFVRFETGVRSRNVDPGANERGLAAARLAWKANRVRKQEDRPNLAIDLYRQSLLSADSYSAQAGLGLALLRSGQTAEAKSTIGRLVAKTRRGKIAYRTSDLGFVLEIADACETLGLKKDGDDLYAALRDSPVHRIDTRFSLPALDRTPAHQKAMAVFVVGMSELRSHHNGEAIRLFQRTVREWPDWGVGHFMLAYAHAYAGHLDEANQGFADAARWGWKRPQGL